MTDAKSADVLASNWDMSTKQLSYEKTPWQRLEVRLTAAIADQDQQAIKRILRESLRLHHEQKLPKYPYQIPRSHFDGFRVTLCFGLIGDQSKCDAASELVRMACYSGSEERVIFTEQLKHSVTKALSAEACDFVDSSFLLHRQLSYGFRLSEVNRSFEPRQRILLRRDITRLFESDKQPFVWLNVPFVKRDV